MLPKSSRRFRLQAALGVVVASCTVLTVAVPAQAATASGSTVAQSAETAETARRVADVLRVNPNARQISATSVELAPGVEMTVAAAGAAAADSSCPYQWLCMWQHVYRGGARLKFYNCKTEWLGNYSYVDARDGRTKSWRDAISSIWNNQSGDALSAFYNYHLLGDRLIGYLSAGNYLQDLTRDSSREGGNWNDKIDRVAVC